MTLEIRRMSRRPRHNTCHLDPLRPRDHNLRLPAFTSSTQRAMPRRKMQLLRAINNLTSIRPNPEFGRHPDGTSHFDHVAVDIFDISG